MIKSKFESLRRKKAFEEDRKLTLRTIAEETGLALATVHRVSSGEIAKVYLSTIDTLCEYFGCSVGDFLYREDSNEPTAE